MKSWNELAEQAKADGFSVQIMSGIAPRDGYMVALTGHEEIIPVQALTVDRLTRYVRDHFDALMEGDTYFGAWRDGDDVYLDVSERVASRAKALFLGSERSQLAVWDVANGVEVTCSVPA